ncbi:hypothetical protein P691DRAFT_802738 [Macrolepiota fuliginosa MF-IS2]|uniref:Uncharacterized protein n=1 Tax=Macrolepiota fuliginosa MF-IS2 TaxID=1400762 RepID=A0A9P5WWJ6_9AGAR|nr:hypothetical protein P691DRAFT_802738 [Macrolepiota fuliginosa MF-IS2]
MIESDPLPLLRLCISHRQRRQHTRSHKEGKGRGNFCLLRTTEYPRSGYAPST